MEKKIEKAIRETLVVDNKQSIKYAVDKIAKLFNEELKKAHESGWKEGADHMYGSGRDSSFNPFKS